jgi:hypothetical protein
LLLGAKSFKFTLRDLMHLEVVSRQPGDFAGVRERRDRALVHSDRFGFSISFSTSLVIVFNSGVRVQGWHIRDMYSYEHYRQQRIFRPWRGAALARERRPRDVCLEACMTGNLVKQAAPGNVSARVRFVCPLRGSKRSDGQNRACGNSREPPV